MKESLLQDVIDKTKQLAIVHGKATLSGDYKSGNAAFDELATLIPIIRKYGKDGATALLSLLDDTNDSVVCWAATSLLKSNEAEAVAALERVAKTPGILAFNASMVLKQWKTGQLVLP